MSMGSAERVPAQTVAVGVLVFLLVLVLAITTSEWDTALYDVGVGFALIAWRVMARQ